MAEVLFNELLTRASFTPPGTDPELIAAVEAHFGPLAVDLAATAEDTKAPRWIGPDRDSLTVNWHHALDGGLGWLNPVVGDIEPWVRKCAMEGRRGARLLLLSQAAIDAPWFWEYVWPYAAVHALYPRLTYEGQLAPLIVSAYNCGVPARTLRQWRWKDANAD